MKINTLQNFGLKAACLALCLLCFVSPPAFSADPIQTLEYGELKTGVTAYTFLPNTVLREGHAESSKVVAQLKPGSALRVLQKLANQTSVNGFEDYFYKVQTLNATPATSGVVWGGHLSKSAFPQGKAMLVLALAGTGKNSNEKSAKAMLIENNKIVSEASFKPIEMPESHSFGYSISASKFDTTAFAGKPPITKFSFEYGACDYPYGDILVGTTGNKVRYLLEEVASGNEEGGTGFDYVLPHQKGGAANKLTIVRTTENFAEKKKHVIRTVYRWDGEKFVK